MDSETNNGSEEDIALRLASAEFARLSGTKVGRI